MLYTYFYLHKKDSAYIYKRHAKTSRKKTQQQQTKKPTSKFMTKQ